MRRLKRAGWRAGRKYGQLRKLWLRRTRRGWILVGAVMLALAIGVNLALVWLPPIWNWVAGAITGALFAMFVVARDTPPGYIEQWQLGGWAEERTERVLRPLECEGWQVRHDLAAAHGEGNLDHVVIGPGGVFLLDSKRFLGEVFVEGDRATVRRLEDPGLSYPYDAAKRLIPLAMQVRDRLRTGTRASQYVRAIVVVWAEFPQKVAGNRCTYVHGDHLATWLRQEPQRVAPERVAQFADALRA